MKKLFLTLLVALFSVVGLSAQESREVMKSYEGIYSSPQLPIHLHISLRGDVLTAQGSGQPAFELTYKSPARYENLQVGITIEFFPKENKLVFEQAGMRIEMTRSAHRAESKVKVNPAVLDTYAGVYSSANLPMKLTIKREKSELTAQLSMQPAFPLDCKSERVFENKALGLEIEFFPKEKKLVLKQMGQTLEMKKEE
ncbi:MAG: hypothetical protein Q3998_00065 [Porphyromonas sp.]|nr:hypothetical protein [Porphyromonas sp.]